MMHLATVLTAGLAASGTVASNWFPGAKAAYNKWHETELERWLSDHDIPHPTPADRADLEALVDKSWKDVVVEPYKSWDLAQLRDFLGARGKEEADQTKDRLVSQVKDNWYETEESAAEAWASAKDWILDTWTESQLKAFCDKHGIPVPQPRHGDSLLDKARSGYETAARKLGETAAYPGDWLYATWSESDLKSWLDTHGFPVPQPSKRDKLVASVRRNARLAYLKAQRDAAGASASAKAAYATLTDTVIDAWSESQLKAFCDENGIPVPHGTRAKELRALVGKRRAKIVGDSAGARASSAFGAATSKAGNEYAKASDSASAAARDAFDSAVGSWPESRLKAYLDARGVPAPRPLGVDELRALVRKHAHEACAGWGAWTLDDLSRDELKRYLAQHGGDAARAAADRADATREELLRAALSALSSASAAGGADLASATSYLAAATAGAKRDALDGWSDSDLEAYLDSCGVAVPQGCGLEELKALAREQAALFRHGTSRPGDTIFAKLGETAREGWNWVAQQLSLATDAARDKVDKAKVDKAKVDKAKEDKAKEEL